MSTYIFSTPVDIFSRENKTKNEHRRTHSHYFHLKKILKMDTGQHIVIQSQRVKDTIVANLVSWGGNILFVLAYACACAPQQRCAAPASLVREYFFNGCTGQGTGIFARVLGVIHK